MPTASNHCAMSWFSGAAAETKNRRRPPKRSRIVENTSLSATACSIFRSGGTALPSSPGLGRLHSQADGPVEDALLDPAFVGDHVLDPGVCLLEDPGRGGHERRMHGGEVVHDPVDPTVDRRREADDQRQREHHLAERMGQRAVRKPHPFGAAGGSRGVDDAGQVVGSDGVHPLLDDPGRRLDQLLTELPRVRRA